MALETGQALTFWTARTAAALFVLAVVFLSGKQPRGARLASTAGLAAYLLHIWCAFTYFYDWSHQVAYRETERQTAELFGVRWGGGLYLNYLFTVVWIVDCAAWWIRPHQWERQSRVRTAIYVFMAFMVVNGSVVVWLLRALGPAPVSLLAPSRHLNALPFCLEPSAVATVTTLGSPLLRCELTENAYGGSWKSVHRS